MLGNKGTKKHYRNGGTRGGQDQFKWEDVKSDKERGQSAYRQTQRHTETDTHRDRYTQRQINTHTHTHRQTHTQTDTQTMVVVVYLDSFCLFLSFSLCDPQRTIWDTVCLPLLVAGRRAATCCGIHIMEGVRRRRRSRVSRTACAKSCDR